MACGRSESTLARQEGLEVSHKGSEAMRDVGKKQSDFEALADKELTLYKRLEEAEKKLDRARSEEQKAREKLRETVGFGDITEVRKEWGDKNDLLNEAINEVQNLLKKISKTSKALAQLLKTLH